MVETTKTEEEVAVDVYERLREFLDGLPSGLPKTDAGVELKALRWMYTPEEAEMTMRLRQFPEPAPVIAKRCGLDEAETAEMLANMARRGLIMSITHKDHVFYQAYQYVVGVYEFQVDRMDREFAELVEELMDEHVAISPAFQRSVLGQFRVVPVNSAVDAVPTVASYEQIRELVKKQKLACVTDCICRKEKVLLEEGCGRPVEGCMGFGVAAQYYIHNGKAREISIDEALAYIDRAEENALVLMPSNSKDIFYICSCCGCCCGLLRVLKMQDRPADRIRSAFQARIDPDLCSTCGTCVERCQMEAINEDGEANEVDLARCIGCGLCISTCDQGAISLVPRAGTASIPANAFHMLSGMSRERGLGFGKLNPIMRMTRVPLFIKMLPALYKSGLAKPAVNVMARLGWV